MKNNTRTLARAALLAALGTALLYISALIPTGRVGIIAIAGLLGCAAVISCGMAPAWAVFAVTAALSFLIVPLRSCCVLYAVFLGWYPIAKSLIEHLKNTALQWVTKLGLLNLAFTALLLLARQVLTDGGLPELSGWMIAAVYAGLNVVFVIYDLLITRLVPVYINRVAGKIFKQGG